MKSAFLSVAALLMLSLSAGTTAQAQSACSQTSPVSYRSDSGSGTVEKRTATETQLATAFTYGGYSSAANSTPAAGTINDVFQLTSTYSAQIEGRALVWRQNNSGTGLASNTANSQVNPATPYQSKVTLTFTREVANLTLVIQDIDKGTLAGNGGSDYTDEVDFYPTNGSGAATDISSAGAVTTSFGINGTAANSATCAYQSPFTLDGVTQVGVRGTALNGGATSNPSRVGNVTITFTKPVKTLQLTFRNLNTITTSQLRLQTIGIEQLSWCSQADLTTTIATEGSSTPAAGSTGRFNVSFRNVGDLATQGVAAQVQLSRNLANVVATNGGTYSPNTGVVTYSGTAAIEAYQGVLTSVISYTVPAAGTTVTATSTIATTTSQGLNPNADNATASVRAAAPLPVSLARFEATRAGTDVELAWTTASELNNDYFAIERSLDGQEFATIGRVSGHGTTPSANTYAYRDANVAAPAGSRLYYRLRQVDLAGTATYSPVRTVDAAAAVSAILSLYPNPALADAAAVTLDLSRVPQGSYQARLLSLTGVTLASAGVVGGQVAPLALPTALPAGTYVVLVTGNGLRLTQRLVRQ